MSSVICVHLQKHKLKIILGSHKKFNTSFLWLYLVRDIYQVSILKELTN